MGEIRGNHGAIQESIRQIKGSARTEDQAPKADAAAKPVRKTKKAHEQESMDLFASELGGAAKAGVSKQKLLTLLKTPLKQLRRISPRLKHQLNP